MTESKMTESKKKNVTPSASAESASLHPSMSLAQSIHRLTMIHTGHLSKQDATSICGIDPDALRNAVLRQILSGDKSIAEAIQDSQSRIQLLKEGQITSIDSDEGPLLNAQLYNHVATTLSLPPLSQDDMTAITSHHEATLATLEELIVKSTQEMGDMEILAAKLSHARYCSKSLSKSIALSSYDRVLESPKLSTGKKLDALLEISRVCSFWNDVSTLSSTLDKAHKVIEKGGDWDRRNRLKAYTALSQIVKRDLESSSKLLMEGIATFSCAELCDYGEFVSYAVIMAVMYVGRVELKKGVVDGSEILSVAKDIPVVVCFSSFKDD